MAHSATAPASHIPSEPSFGFRSISLCSASFVSFDRVSIRIPETRPLTTVVVVRMNVATSAPIPITISLQAMTEDWVGEGGGEEAGRKRVHERARLRVRRMEVINELHSVRDKREMRRRW